MWLVMSLIMVLLVLKMMVGLKVLFVIRFM